VRVIDIVVWESQSNIEQTAFINIQIHENLRFIKKRGEGFILTTHFIDKEE